MEERKRKRTFRVVWVLSCTSLLLIAVEQIVSFHRQTLFGYEPGAAGDNFVYNFTIFFPVALLTLLLSLVALVKFLYTWHAIECSKDSLRRSEAFSIIPALIPLTALLYFVRHMIEIIVGVAAGM